MLLLVPVGTFQVQTADVSTVFGRLGKLFVILTLVEEVELQEIDRKAVSLTAELLQERSRETCWVSESTDPEDGWCTLLNPLLEESVSLAKVDNPSSERLEREVGLTPHDWHLVVTQVTHHDLEDFVDELQTLDTKFKFHEGRLHDLKQHVVSRDLLYKDSRQWVIAIVSVLVLELDHIDLFGNQLFEARDLLEGSLLDRLAALARLGWLQTQDGVEQLNRVEDLRSDFSVSVLAVSLREVILLHVALDQLQEVVWDEC